MSNLYVNSFVSINNNTVNVNGSNVKFEATSIPEFCKAIYKNLNISYPKFYKMDNMSKLGFLATEFLMQNQELDQNTSLIFANRSSSLDSDINYQNSIANKARFLPNPSVFVYTLPNIVLGEISIKNKFTGENIFLVLDQFRPEILIEIILLQKLLQKADKFILTWIEVIEKNVEIFSFYISAKKEFNSLVLNKKNIKHLTKNIL